MYVIIGSTGKVGNQVAKILLSGGHPVRVIGRSAERLAPLQSKGADPFTGDVLDTDFLASAFTGASAVFSMIPPNVKAENYREYANRVSRSIESALKKARVTRVVNLSSVGADLPDKTGPISGLHDHEERLNKIRDLGVVHLRATYFMENVFMNMDLIRNQGINGSAIRGDLMMSMIATQDIAEEAARYMTDENLGGKWVRYLLGQRDLTMAEMTRVIGRAIGKPDLRYVQFKYEDAEKAMIGMGIAPGMARTYTEMARAFNEGIIAQVTRTPDSITATSIEDFAEVFASAYCVDEAECRAS